MAPPVVVGLLGQAGIGPKVNGSASDRFVVGIK